MNKIILFLFLIGTIFSGCSDIENIEYYEEDIDENVLSFSEFKQITKKGFDNILIDENFCYEFESYDSYYDECITDINCDENLGECEEFDRIYDEFLVYLDNQDYYAYNMSFDYSNHGYNEDNDLINEYFIENNDSLTYFLGNENKLTQEIWYEFSMLIPKEFRENLDYFGIFTDGVDETLAYVAQRDYENQPEIWYMAFDVEDYKQGFEKEITHTLIHEFSHIFSLEDSQIDYYTFENCQTLQLDEGCLNLDSYQYEFYKEFWKGEINEKHLDLVDKLGEEEASYELYNLYPNEFVSEYAATNLVEDFAESFTSYVLFSHINKVYFLILTK